MQISYDEVLNDIKNAGILSGDDHLHACNEYTLVAQWQAQLAAQPAALAVSSTFFSGLLPLFLKSVAYQPLPVN
jgi:hypothetical protein